MKNDPKLSGCIVLIDGGTFLSKQIIMHNRFIAKIEGHQPLPYSHAEILLWHDGTLWTIGARESGAEISKAVDYYKNQPIMILKPTRILTAMEEYGLWQFWTYIDKSKYRFSNLVSWIQYVHTFGKVWLSIGKDRNYCYQLAAKFANSMHRWPANKSLDRVSLFDLHENKNYCEYEEISI
jgi:hypothetical protein